MSRDSGAIFGLLLLKLRVRDAAAFAANIIHFRSPDNLDERAIYNLPIRHVQSHL